MADAFRLEADGGAEDQFAAFGFEQIDGTDGGVKTALDEADDVRQGFAGIVAVRHELADLLQSEEQMSFRKWCLPKSCRSPPECGMQITECGIQDTYPGIVSRPWV